MNTKLSTPITTKLAALMLALGINTVIMGGMALIFTTSAHSVPSLAVAANVAPQIDRTAA